MLKILFFASIRERLETERLQFPLAADIDSLINALAREYGAHWREVLRAANVIVAVNQEVVDRDHGLQAGDEIAFFPPVTGG